MKPPAAPIWHSPDALLRRVAAELAQCQTMLHGLEEAVGPHMTGSLAADHIHTLQDIDRLSQTLGDLATCLGVLATDLEGAAAIDARRLLAAMRLDALAQRLGGGAVQSAPADTRIALF